MDAFNEILRAVEDGAKATAEARYHAMRQDYLAARDFHLDKFLSYFDWRQMSQAELISALDKLRHLLPAGNPSATTLRMWCNIALQIETEAADAVS